MFWRRAGLLVVALAVALALAEATCRWFYLDRVVAEVMRNTPDDKPYGNRVRVSDPEVGWFLRGYEFDAAGLTIRFPRPRTFSRHKPPGRFRILVLGDSVGEIWVSQNPTDKFPQMLEDNLNRRAPGRYEVVNVSVGSYDTAQRAAVLRQYLSGFDFDLIVIQHTFNDNVGPYVFRRTRAGFDEYERFELDIPGWRGLEGSALLDSAFLRAINLAAYNHLAKAFPRHFGIIGRFSDHQAQAYQWLRDYCASKGIGLFVLMFPPLTSRTYASWQRWHDQNGEAKRLFQALHIDYYDLYDDFEAAGFAKLHGEPSDHTHPNPVGHRIAAERLQERLAAEGLVPRVE